MRRRKVRLVKARGFVITEACVSMALVGMVLGVASLLLTQNARATEYFLNYRRAQLAAESCVERMRLGTLEIDDHDFTDDSGIRFQIRVADAPLAWQPLRHVEVLALVHERKSRSARYAVQTYLAPPFPSRGNNP